VVMNLFGSFNLCRVMQYMKQKQYTLVC
jgi:hypothetical protein